MNNLLGIDKGDVYFCGSDIGWVVGHHFTVYGPLLVGGSTVVYEGKPVGTPDCE
jgi:propionyl-CoA synthetase